MRVLVPDTLDRPGQETEIGKLSKREVDAAGPVPDRLGRNPGHAAFMQRFHVAVLGLHLFGICGTRAHPAPPIAATVRVTTKLATRVESRPVHVAVPRRPSHRPTW